jgi:hypothetical protein
LKALADSGHQPVLHIFLPAKPGLLCALLLMNTLGWCIARGIRSTPTPRRALQTAKSPVYYHACIFQFSILSPGIRPKWLSLLVTKVISFSMATPAISNRGHQLASINALFIESARVFIPFYNQIIGKFLECRFVYIIPATCIRAYLRCLFSRLRQFVQIFI